MTPAQRTSWLFFILIGFVVGGGLGYVVGVSVGARARGPEASGSVDSEPTLEKAADLTHPRFLQGRGWELSYPANWTLAATEDPDHEVSLTSPGISAVLLTIRDHPCDATDELARTMISYGTRLLEDATRTDLASWGRYPGRGQTLEGKLVEAGDGTIRVFVANVGERSFTAIERFADEDRKAVEPGFRLVQDSFTLK